MFEFAANPIKLRRAIDSLPKDATEEQVKEVYMKMGGYVVPQESTPEPARKLSVSKSTSAQIKKVVKKVVEVAKKKVAKKVVKK
jgi:hypothetical protein